MAEGTSDASQLQISLTGRPEWPYGDWQPDTLRDNTGPDTATLHTENQIAAGGLPTSNPKTDLLLISEQPSGEKRSDSDEDCLLFPSTGSDEVITEHACAVPDPDSSIGSEEVVTEDACAGPDPDSDSYPEHAVSYDPLPRNRPMNHLLAHFQHYLFLNSNELQSVEKDILPFIESTLTYLRERYELFEGSYIRLVGSAGETSRIGEPDEFDFAVMLPSLGTRTIYSLLYKNESITPEDKVLELIRDLELSAPENELFHHLHATLNELWYVAMKTVSNDQWGFYGEPVCHRVSSSVAATFHLVRKRDNFIVDLDVCFWIPLAKDVLEKAPREMQQRDFLAARGLDEHGLVYVILPKDEGIEFALNRNRFATSFFEIKSLTQFGPHKGQLVCYKLAKCIVRMFLPKIRKRHDCTRCWDSLISSFCLKQIVLYMVSNYQSEATWSEDQLANRVLEIFGILQHCLIINGSVSSYFSPYNVMPLTTGSFSPSSCTLTGVHSDDGDQCTLPSDNVTEIFANDDISEKILNRYFRFLEADAWNPVQVVCRLYETLDQLCWFGISERAEAGGDWADDFYQFFKQYVE